MCQAVKCDLLLYADDSCLTVTHKDITVIEDTLNNKLSIHVGKTESILFGTKYLLSKENKLNIKYGNQQIENNETVKYLGVSLDSKLNGKSMVKSILSKINNKSKFLYRKQTFLNKDKIRR